MDQMFIADTGTIWAKNKYCDHGNDKIEIA